MPSTVAWGTKPTPAPERMMSSALPIEIRSAACSVGDDFIEAKDDEPDREVLLEGPGR